MTDPAGFAQGDAVFVSIGHRGFDSDIPGRFLRVIPNAPLGRTHQVEILDDSLDHLGFGRIFRFDPEQLRPVDWVKCPDLSVLQDRAEAVRSSALSRELALEKFIANTENPCIRCTGPTTCTEER